MGLQTLRRTDGQDSPWQATAADNARLVRQVIEEIWNGGDLALADQVFAPDYVNHGGLIPDLVHGPEAIKVSVALYRLAFPAFRVAVVDLLAQGQTVALRWAAHRAPGHDGGRDAPDRDPDTLLGMTFARLIAGQVQESWTCWEKAGTEPFDPLRVSSLHHI
jgi:predicted SnoaL-like aldol condensation-catalyzing enzyme